MTASGHDLPALDELRESLRAAAERDVAARAPARRRRRRRGVAVIAAVLLGGAAAAGAAELISAGAPVRDTRRVPTRYHPSTGLQLSVKAKDTPLWWGVGVYQTSGARSCAVAGRVRGAQLGELRGPTFHAYGPGRAGVCSNPHSKTSVSFDTFQRDGRTIVYGLARPGARSVFAVVDGRRSRARTGIGGAFVLVFGPGAAVSSVIAG
jgi:hypothetical protein